MSRLVGVEGLLPGGCIASGFSELFKVDLVDAEDCSESLLQHIKSEGVEL